MNRFNVCKRMALILVAAAAVISISIGDGYAARSVSATLNSTQFPLDMTAVLTITAEGGRSVNVSIPEVENLTFHRRGQSSQIQMINGSFSASVSTVYLVEPHAPGKYTIPPITVHSDGEKLFTKPISFEVKDIQSSQSSGRPGQQSSKARLGSGEAGKIAFLRVEAAKTSVYTGEMVPVTIKAYINRKVQPNKVNLPVLKSDSFVLSPLSAEPEQSMETIHGSDYLVINWDSYLTGIKEGHHKLSLELEAELLIPQRTRRPSRFNDRSFFNDDFFRDFFHDYTSRNVEVVSPEFEIEAKPLPAQNQPPGFNGAIGNFTLEVAATPTVADVGEPITLHVRVKGTGNFDRVTQPEFPETGSWKHYSPSTDFQPEGDRPDKGVKLFEQAIVARDSSITQVPALTLTFFDPDAGQYRQVSSQPIPLKIHQEARQLTVSPTAGQETQQKREETAQENRSTVPGLAPIHLELGKLHQSIKPLIFQTWFIALVVIFAIILSSVALIQVNRKRHKKNPELLRRVRLKKSIQKHLATIDQAVQRQDPASFLAVCRLAIQEVLGQVWNIEPAAITLADIEKRLKPDSTLIAIFSMADKAAYGGHSLSAEEMQDLSTQLKDAFGQLP